MPFKLPIKGALYLHSKVVYKVLLVSSGTDEVILEDTATGLKAVVRFALFEYGYERVFRVKEVANLLGRHPRSIYRYEQRGLIEKPIIYQDKRARGIRYYRQQDVLDMHEMISLLHQGRPRKDRRVVNNTLPDIVTLKKRIKEKYGDN